MTPQRVLNDVLLVLLCFLGGTARKLMANDRYDRCSSPYNVTHVTGAAPGFERYSLTGLNVARQFSKSWSWKAPGALERGGHL